MTSCQRRTPALLLALPALLVLPACAGGPPIVSIPGVLNCAGRIPPQLRAEVAGAPLPDDNSVGEWVAFADAQSGRLEAANDRKTTALWIIDQCEAEERAAAARLATPSPWWRRLFGGSGR